MTLFDYGSFSLLTFLIATFFGLSAGVVGGAIFGDAASVSRVQMTALVRKSLVCVSAVSLTATVAVLIFGPLSLVGLFPTIGLGFALYVRGAVERYQRKVDLALSAARALAADNAAVLSVLDDDRDGVVSERDLERSERKVVGLHLSRAQYFWLTTNLSEVGHALDDEDEIFIIGRNDVFSLIARLEGKYAGWCQF